MTRKLPLWAIGLANAPLGFFYGFLNTSLPLLLATHGVPLPRIATISAIAFSPTFWVFLLAPILEIRLDRRSWSLLWTAVAAACIVGCILSVRHLALFTILATTGCTAITLFGSSLGGWLPEFVPDDSRGHVGAWFQIANLGAAALYGVLAVFIVRNLSAALSATVLALLLLAPNLLFVFFPKPSPRTRSPSQVFHSLFHDLRAMFHQREFILILAAFLIPNSCFALTNLFAGLGADFNASPREVTFLCGAGVAIACSLGSYLGGPIADRYSRIHVYIVTGVAGALVAAIAAFAPHTLLVFALVTLAYNFIQGINYTASAALCFHLVGANNPIAATQFSVLFCAINLPITYMTWLDGRGYARHGVRGLFATDAATALLAGTILLAFITFLAHRRRLTPSQPT